MKAGRLVVLIALVLSGSISLWGQDLPELAQGMKLYGSYHGGAIDNVGLENGNLYLRVPLFS